MINTIGIIEIKALVQLGEGIRLMRQSAKNRPRFDTGEIAVRIGNHQCEYCRTNYHTFVTNCKNCGGTVK